VSRQGRDGVTCPPYVHVFYISQPFAMDLLKTSLICILGQASTVCLALRRERCAQRRGGGEGRHIGTRRHLTSGGGGEGRHVSTRRHVTPAANTTGAAAAAAAAAA